MNTQLCLIHVNGKKLCRTFSREIKLVPSQCELKAFAHQFISSSTVCSCFYSTGAEISKAALFSDCNIEDHFVPLTSQRMEKGIKRILFFLLLAGICSPTTEEQWKASVVKSIEALVDSCVVLPCTFTYPGSFLSTSRLRGIWHRKDKWNEIFYHEDTTSVLDNFKGRTKMLGNLGQNNCTLEIVQVKNHDIGPFCFRIEFVKKDTNQPTTEKFSFVEECAEIKMLEEPPQPELIQSNTAVQGKPYAVTCSVRHTCPSHVPVFTWSRGSEDDIIQIQKPIVSGIWETQSIMVFIPGENDDHTEITCSATFNGGRRSSTSIKLNVKRTGNIYHLIIPVAVAIGTAVIFGVFCIAVMKKYKNRIAELQSREGSMFNRLSRMSRRFHSSGQ
ncbi:sialic acid-binding Ig-like lectin 13 isoform X1 [Xiphophorus couchianus]|uniref:sialic acid-binding Ig-like lectin 13 isoform X1 n=2 Tax=Xiphophorus couchianus TaxID=32473 RepID=UPI001016B0F8|nr:sialic acid-binding Ig-like lectin 13 isoform X1 [Xiphophorus couchianus]